MIFTSWIFIFGFLPLALVGFWLTSRVGRSPAAAWLVLVSLVFYGAWAPILILLLVCSILLNYGLSIAIRAARPDPVLQTALLIAGLAGNLGALFYYKYLDAVVLFLGGGAFLDAYGLAGIALPLGISFFTFTQIGYLIDCREGSATDTSFRDYVLFVTFFPHLIAGPLLHNTEMMPQFADRTTYRFSARNTAAGLTIFIIGMAKKALVADQLASGVKDAFRQPYTLHTVNAWEAALGYSLQLYFDFSGYSDMAIGLALMFNIQFPLNFNSPYKARSIVDFWQRWHMTLTRYLTQYLYNPMAMALRRRRMARRLPMSRKALSRPGPFLGMVVGPTILTMSLAGIWHGAGLQFLVFGVLHGLYLSVNHAARLVWPRRSVDTRPAPMRWSAAVLSWGATYLAVLIAQVFFRASSVGSALDLLAAMAGKPPSVEVAVALNPLQFHDTFVGHLFGVHAFAATLSPADIKQLAVIVIGFAIVLLCPNTQQIMAEAGPVLESISRPAPRLLLWRPSIRWALVTAGLAEITLLSLGGTSEFLYFQF